MVRARVGVLRAGEYGDEVAEAGSRQGTGHNQRASGCHEPGNVRHQELVQHMHVHIPRPGAGWHVALREQCLSGAVARLMSRGLGYGFARERTLLGTWRGAVASFLMETGDTP